MYQAAGVRRNPACHWKVELQGVVQGAPVADGAFVYLVTDKGRAYCLELSGGRELWSIDLGSEGRASAPLVTDTLMFFSAPGGALWCLDKKTGAKRWILTYDRRVSSLERVPESTASPLIADGMLIASGGSNGYVYGVDPASGKVRWRLLTFRGVYADPVEETGGGVILAGLDGDIHLVRANDGGSIPNRFNHAWPWQWKLDHEIQDTPAYNSGRLFMLDVDGKLEVVSTKGPGIPGEGGPAWSWRSTFGPTRRASVDKPQVIVGIPGRIQALDFETGSPLWGYELYPRRVTVTPPSLTPQHVFIGDDEGAVWCLRRTDGQDEWNLNVGSPVVSVVMPVGELLIVATKAGRILCLKEKE